jgi:hypothetical protein
MISLLPTKAYHMIEGEPFPHLLFDKEPRLTGYNERGSQLEYAESVLRLGDAVTKDRAFQRENPTAWRRRRATREAAYLAKHARIHARWARIKARRVASALSSRARGPLYSS